MKVMVVGDSSEKLKSDPFLWPMLRKRGITIDQCVLESLGSGDGKLGKKQLRECGTRITHSITQSGVSFVLLLGSNALMAVTGLSGINQRRGVPIELFDCILLPCFSTGILFHDDRKAKIIESDIALFADIVKTGKVPVEEGLNYRIVKDESNFKEMLRDMAGSVSFDIETNGLYPWQVNEGDHVPAVQSLGIGTKTTQWCLPLNHPQSPWPRHRHRELIRQLDEKMGECFIITHNGKFDALWMRVHYDVKWQIDFDTLMAHYMVDENSLHGLKVLATAYYGAPNYDVGKDLKTGQDKDLATHCKYLAHDLFYTRKLRFTLEKLLIEDEGTYQVFNDLMMPCINKFVDIEFNGVFVDRSRMAEARLFLEQERQEALSELSLYQEGINWRSPPQLSKFFFGKLGLNPLDVTPTGKPSTSESVLLRLNHPAAAALIKFRGADKNLSTFIQGWENYLDSNDRMHPTFKLHGAVTGRPSCEHPNLQQVPRYELIRSLITAPPGWVLLELDESQIEMRIAAEVSGDAALLQAFINDEDVHWLTATREITRSGGMGQEVISTARAFSKSKKNMTYGEAAVILYQMGPDAAVNINKVWKEARKKAKAINFGYLYGMWWRKFKDYARDNYGVSITDEQAEASREAFFELYPGLAAWHKRQKRFVNRHGYVRAISGRKRRLPNATSKIDSQERREAERQAINSPVQCFANELNLMILLQLTAEFGDDVLRPVGTIHDAILMEVRIDHATIVTKRALEISERPQWLHNHSIMLQVPIKGDAKLGPWSKGVNLKEYVP